MSGGRGGRRVERLLKTWEYFQVQGWMLETGRAERVDDKIGSFV